MNIKLQMEIGAMRKQLDELAERVARLETVSAGNGQFDQLSTEIRMIKARMARGKPADAPLGPPPVV